MTTISTATIKRGDATTLTLDLGTDVSGLGTARVLIGQPRATPLIAKTGTVAGQIVTVALDPTETATVGTYRVEVEMSTGPTTFPSDGYAQLTILADLG